MHTEMARDASATSITSSSSAGSAHRRSQSIPDEAEMEKEIKRRDSALGVNDWKAPVEPAEASPVNNRRKIIFSSKPDVTTYERDEIISEGGSEAKEEESNQGSPTDQQAPAEDETHTTQPPPQ